jgi:hypothetical protein
MLTTVYGFGVEFHIKLFFCKFRFIIFGLVLFNDFLALMEGKILFFFFFKKRKDWNDSGIGF